MYIVEKMKYTQNSVISFLNSFLFCRGIRSRVLVSTLLFNHILAMVENTETIHGNAVPLSVENIPSSEFTNPIHTFFISPSDSPAILLINTVFDGKSFGGWKRSMWIALTAKNRSGFIDGSTAEPEAGTDLHRAWSRSNMVISWLLNSLSREISKSVLYYATVKDIWAELEDRFGQSFGPHLFQLQKELSDLVQGSSDTAAYYTKIKRLWDELDTLDSLILCSLFFGD